MRRSFAAVTAAIAIMLFSSTPAPAAKGPPSAACYGQIIAGIAATWPWAHEDRIDFAPPPGAVALWIRLFGDDLGISSVRQLQVLFCSEQ
jgi:hypothetical protein